MPKGKSGRMAMNTVMGEFKRGTLKSGSGAPVKSKKQAIAIGYGLQDRAKKKKGKRRK